MPICWDSLNKQQFLQCDNPGQPQTRISVEISVNVYEGQWVFPAVLHEGPDSCLGINVLVTSVLHHHPTHAMPMNSRTEPKKPVAGPGQFLPAVLEDKAQLWWRWWWWLDLVSSSTCGGMEGPAVWLGLNTGLPSPLPACSSLTQHSWDSQREIEIWWPISSKECPRLWWISQSPWESVLLHSALSPVFPGDWQAQYQHYQHHQTGCVCSLPPSYQQALFVFTLIRSPSPSGRARPQSVEIIIVQQHHHHHINWQY